MSSLFVFNESFSAVGGRSAGSHSSTHPNTFQQHTTPQVKAALLKYSEQIANWILNSSLLSE